MIRTTHFWKRTKNKQTTILKETLDFYYFIHILRSTWEFFSYTTWDSIIAETHDYVLVAVRPSRIKPVRKPACNIWNIWGPHWWETERSKGSSNPFTDQVTPVWRTRQKFTATIKSSCACKTFFVFGQKHQFNVLAQCFVWYSTL